MRTACWSLLTISLLCICPVAGIASPGWSHSFDSAKYKLDWEPIAVDASGGVIMAGSFVSTVDFGGGPLTAAGFWDDIFVAKFDASGNHVWSQRFGDVNTDEAHSVDVDALGNVVVVGECSGTVDFGGGPLEGGSNDLFVTKFDAAGNHIWSRLFDVFGLNSRSMTMDVSGGVIVVGDFTGTADFGGRPLTAHPSGPDIFVVKLDAAGNHVWSERFGGTAAQTPYSVAVDASGSVVVAGEFTGTVDFGGGALTSTAPAKDIFVAKLDSDGNHVWSHDYGDNAGNQSGHCVAFDASGSVLMAGKNFGTVDFGGGPLVSGSNMFVVKFDAAGNHVWSHGFEASPNGLSVDASGSVVVTGGFNGTVDFGGGPMTSPGSTGNSVDVFVVKFTADGNHVWSAHYGDIVFQDGYGVAVDGSGRVIMTGLFDGTVDFGGNPLTNVGGEWDLFVVSYTPDILTGVGEDEIPRAINLMQNIPNPFTPDTRITFGLSEASEVSLRVYDASGRLVRVLFEGHRGPGPHVVQWNGDDESRRQVPSGVYFCRLEAGGEAFTRKLVVLR